MNAILVRSVMLLAALAIIAAVSVAPGNAQESEKPRLVLQITERIAHAGARAGPFLGHDQPPRARRAGHLRRAAVAAAGGADEQEY